MLPPRHGDREGEQTAATAAKGTHGEGRQLARRNLVCGQLAPQLQAVNRTRHRPSAREPRKRWLTEVDTNLRGLAPGFDQQAELDAGQESRRRPRSRS